MQRVSRISAGLSSKFPKTMHFSHPSLGGETFQGVQSTEENLRFDPGRENPEITVWTVTGDGISGGDIGVL